MMNNTVGLQKNSVDIKGSLGIPVDGESLVELQREIGRRKKRNGIFLLFFVFFLFFVGNVVNGLFFHSWSFWWKSFYLSLFFFFVILSVKFDFLSLFINKYIPSFREPDDFLSRVK